MKLKNRYKEYFKNYENICVYKQFKRIIYGKNDLLVINLFNYLIENIDFSKKERLKICDLGGGDGKRILNLCEKLKKVFPKLEFELLLVEESVLYSYRREKELNDFFNKVEIFSCDFQEFNYFEDFDFVFCIHSIFAINNTLVIDKILNLLSYEGHMIFISNMPNSFIGNLKKIIDKDCFEKRFEIDSVIEYLIGKKIVFRKIEYKVNFSLDSLEKNVLLEFLSLGGVNDNLVFDNLLDGEDFVEKEVIVDVFRS